MSAKNSSNMLAPTAIKSPCDLQEPGRWANAEADAVLDSAVRAVAHTVCNDLDSFVRWPRKPLLLWKSAFRGKHYFKYTDRIKAAAKEKNVVPDGRQNGPAILAYLLAGGLRPERLGSRNRWSVHHVYSGKFPYVRNKKTLHAIKHGNHFTQGAGLVALHPIADQMADEFPFFAWLLRAQAFLRFRYDPDHVFSESTDQAHDEYGFVDGQQTEIVEKDVKFLAG